MPEQELNYNQVDAQKWVDVCPFHPLESRLTEHPLGSGELYKFRILCPDHFDRAAEVEEQSGVTYEGVRAYPTSQVQFLRMNIPSEE